MKNKFVTEEQKEVKKFICLLLGLVIIIIGVYFFTRAFVTKDLNKEKTEESSYTTGAINDNVLIVGTMFNRPEKEYYVAAFSEEDTALAYYNIIISKYSSEKDALKVYHLSLDNALNKDYVATEDENSSTKFTNLENLKLGKFTLLKIKEGKVTKFITDIESAKKEFKIEK